MTATLSPPPAAAAPATSRQTQAWTLVGRYGALMLLVLLVLVMSVLEPSTFATTSNLINVLNQSALASIIAIGLTFTLVAGEFDLSISNVASLTGVACCTLMADRGLPLPLAIVAAMAMGAVVGLTSGLVVTRLGVNALVATLGIGTVAVGINYSIAEGLPVSVPDPDSLLDLSLGRFLGIPYPIYMMALVAVLAWLLLNRTVLGQSMQAVGGNPVAAALSGVRVDRVRVIAFVLCGTLAGLTGILLASRTGSAAVTAGDSYLLSSFAAAFFGSAVLRDGQFHILGTIIGVVTVSVGFNAIALLGMETYWQYLFQGLVLIVGVGVGAVARKRAAA